MLQALYFDAMGWPAVHVCCLGNLLQIDLLGAQLGCHGACDILHWFRPRSVSKSFVILLCHRYICCDSLCSCSHLFRKHILFGVVISNLQDLLKCLCGRYLLLPVLSGDTERICLPRLEGADNAAPAGKDDPVCNYLFAVTPSAPLTMSPAYLQADGYAKKHLDITRYQKLKKDIERYTRYLHSDTLADNVKAKNI